MALERRHFLGLSLGIPMLSEMLRRGERSQHALSLQSPGPVARSSGPKVLAIIEGAPCMYFDDQAKTRALIAALRAAGLAVFRVWDGSDKPSRILVRKDCETDQEAFFIRELALSGKWPFAVRDPSFAPWGGIVEIEISTAE